MDFRGVTEHFKGLQGLFILSILRGLGAFQGQSEDFKEFQWCSK